MTAHKNDHRIHVRGLLLAAALYGLSLTANANFIARTTHGNFQVIKNGKSASLAPPQTLTGPGNAVASSGTVNAMPGPGKATQGMGATAGGSTASGGVNLSGNAKMPVNGNNVPVAVKTNLGTDVLIPAALGGLGCAASGPAIAMACAAAVGIPLTLAWLDNAGGRINPQTNALEIEDRTPQPVSDGYEYNLLGKGWTRNPQAQCDERGSEYMAAHDPSWGMVLDSATFNPSTVDCDMVYHQTEFKDGYLPGRQWTRSDRFIRRSDSLCPAGHFVRRDGTCRATNDPDWMPASMNDIAPYMKDAPVDPGIVKELSDAGQDLGNPPVTVTGPASITGPTVTNITNNSTTTTTTTNTTTTNNYTYNGSTVTNTGETKATQKTVTVRNPDGTTTTTETETSTEEKTHGEQETADPAEPPEQPTQCDKYPNTVGCAEMDTPDEDIPKRTETVTFEAQDLLGSGQCPADVMVTLNTLGGRNVKAIDWQTFCGQALPLRALVMALASIMAFFIIMPGGVRE